MGTQRREYCFHLGRRLADVLRGTRTLLIASTDLSHYHRVESANALDEVIIHDAARFDVEQMMVDLETQHAEACGGGPMVAVLAAAHELGADSVDILYHCNSGDVTGDYSAVVGYLSAAAVRIH
jgi:AmmeMemoRadiSam system protein B